MTDTPQPDIGRLGDTDMQVVKDMMELTTKLYDAAARAEQAEARAASAESALRTVLSDGMLGAHNQHWDREGTRGQNCPACIANRTVEETARAHFVKYGVKL